MLHTSYTGVTVDNVPTFHADLQPSHEALPVEYLTRTEHRREKQRG
jgi:hypothetical protein